MTEEELKAQGRQGIAIFKRAMDLWEEAADLFPSDRAELFVIAAYYARKEYVRLESIGQGGEAFGPTIARVSDRLDGRAKLYELATQYFQTHAGRLELLCLFCEMASKEQGK